MATTYQDQLGQEQQPRYSANNPYAYAEQYHGDNSIVHGKFENGVYIPGQDYQTHHHEYLIDQHPPAAKPARSTQPRGTLPSLMTSQHLCISDLHWWTAHHHILQECHSKAGVKLGRDAITAAEHKVNGKTKGCVYLSCKSEDDAKKIASWFQDNEFQGKKMAVAYASKDAVRALKTPAAISSNPRPSGGLTSLANHPPTNAHGGINFNRLRQHNRNYTNAGLGPLGAMGGRNGAHKGEGMMPAWQHPLAWTGLEQYPAKPIYHPAMHAGGMLPYMHPMDPSMYGVPGDIQY